MNKYLKSALSNFEKIKEKEYLISPISEIDCEVMVEIVELFTKLGMRDVVQVLKQYKYLKDEEIRDQLIECNMKFNADEYKEVDDEIADFIDEIKETKRDFVTIGEESILGNLIFGFKTIEDYTEEENFIGKLILNPVDISATKQPLYSNHTITFYSEGHMESEMNNFKQQLKKINVKFVYKDIEKEESEEDNDD